MIGRYIYYLEIDPKKPTGIQKKILAQLKEFNKNGNVCELYHIKSKKKSKCRFFLQHIPFWGEGYKKWIYNESFTGLDYVYIRRPSVFDGAFLSFLRKIKEHNPKIKIVVEIPTYPYDDEYSGLAGWFYRSIDKRHRNKMQGLIDAFAVIAWNSTDDSLWGIPVLPISNGIDLEKVSKIKNVIVKADNDMDINLICIAYFSPWHGYEKIIESLGSYYRNKPKRKIIIHMVGKGPELDKYMDIVKKNHLDDKVLFHGEVSNSLDDIYNNIDIGVCSINSKSIGVFLSSQLKSREYLAKGIPIITCGDIDVLQNYDFPYELIVDYNRKINFDRIIDFYDRKIRNNQIKVRDKIRLFAEQNCGWDATMKNVITYLGMNK